MGDVRHFQTIFYIAGVKMHNAKCDDLAWESEAGGRGDVSFQSKNSWGTSPRNKDILVSFLNTYYNFAFSDIFKIKWPKSQEKNSFGFGRL